MATTSNYQTSSTSSSTPTSPVATSSAASSLLSTSINWKPFYAGATGGSVAVFVTCPIEVIKTRLQTKQSRKSLINTNGIKSFPTIRTVARSILASEGPLGFWRGLAPSLAGVIPARATFFGTFATLKHKVGSDNDNDDNSTKKLCINFLCAATAGSIAATITCPIWVLKTRMQLLPSKASSDISSSSSMRVRDLARQMWKQEGPKSFFKGLTASYWGVTEGAIQLMLYEEFKSVAFDEDEITSATPIELFGLAASAKFIAAFATYPHEVVRTRLRDQRTIDNVKAKYTGMFQSIRLIFKEEGIAGLYGGLTPHLLRVVPNAAIMYFIVEVLTRE